MPSLDELLRIVINANPDEWSGGENLPEREDGATYLVYTPDVNVGVAYTTDDSIDDDYRMPGVNFPDPRICRVWLDIVYCGVLVYRAAQLGVDGLRAILPDPHNVLDPDHRREIVGYTVTQREIDLARVTDSILGRGQIEQYLARSAIVVVG